MTSASTALEGRSFRYWSWWLAAFVAAWAATYFAVAPEPVTLLRHNGVFVLVGFAGAFLGNVSAVGGGIVFIPVMIFVFHLPAVDALKVALASQVFGMTSGAVGWWQSGVVPGRALRLAVPGLLAGSAFGSLVVHPTAGLIKGLFGPVSILLGVLTLVLARRGTGPCRAVDVPPRAAVPLVVTAVAGGLVTSWIAIGEGELVAALLMLVYGVDTAVCIGFGVVLLSINSIALAALHQFVLGGIPWSIAAFTGLGCVFGARLAPYLGRRANPVVLKLAFAAIAIADGTLFVVQFLLSYRRP